MSRLRLDLAALRAKDSAGGERLAVSRRALFGLAGAATVGLSPAARALGSAALGPFRMERSRGRVAFFVGGEERWALDVRRFAGRPRLRVEEGGDRLLVELAGALFPGTELPADLTLDLVSGLVGSRMRLALALGGLDARARFEPWLMGLEEARGALRRGVGAAALAPGARLALAARGEGLLRPDWTLVLRGRGVGAATIRGRELVSDHVEIGLLGRREGSLLERPPSRRTVVSLARGDRDWSLDRLLPAPPHGRWIASGGAFETLHLETGASRLERPRAALVAESRTGLELEPAADLETPSGETFRLTLENARLARTLDREGADETALVARFATTPVGLAVDGVSLRLGDPPREQDATQPPPFELVESGGRLTSVRCEPALTEILAPLGGASAGPLRPPPGTRLAFVASPAGSNDPTPSLQTRPVLVLPAARPQLELDRARFSRLRLPAHLTVTAVRPEDFLALEFELVNLRLETAGRPRLVRGDPERPARIVVHFPPQSLYEQAFYEVTQVTSGIGSDGQAVPAESGNETLPTPPVRSRISGLSRLAFRVPEDVEAIPYSLRDLLAACSEYPLAVTTNARPPDPPRRSRLLQGALRLLGIRSKVQRTVSVEPPAALRRSFRPDTPGVVQPQLAPGGVTAQPIPGAELRRFFGPPREPAPEETAIEMPYRLILSPHWDSAWAHAVEPVAGGPTGSGGAGEERYELWHTRLGVRADDGSVDEEDDHYRSVRAVWSPDFRAERPPQHANRPFRSTLDARDRHEIVALSSDFSIPGWKPGPIAVERLMLTSLGAWLDSRGAWEPPGSLEVEEWKHRATMARDHYVRVVYKGYLYPFRHRASLIKVTERKLQPIEEGPQRGQVAAFLRQRMFIVVREPEVTYDYSQAGGRAAWERENPFKRVRITTLTTPDLLDPNGSQIGGFGQQAFWPRTPGGYFAFHLVAWDWRGVKSDFAAPLVFIGASKASSQSALDTVRQDYATRSGDDGEPLSRVFFDGQKIAYAPAVGSSDNTALDSDSLTFSSENGTVSAGEAGFFPALSEAEVRIPAVEMLAASGQLSRIEYSPVYVEHGFGGSHNVSEIFVQIKGDTGTPLRFDGDRSGGVATPNLNIAGLSRRFGPVGAPFSSPPDLASLASGDFDPEKYFEGAGAKILGGIPLADIVAKSFGDGKNVPKMSTELIYPGGDQEKLPEAAKAELLWEPEVVDDPTGTFVQKNSKLKLHASITQRFDAVGEGPDVVVEGEVTDFEIHLIPVVETFLIVSFKRFGFRSESGKKMEVDPQIQGVEFAGPLMFVNELKDYLSSTGMSLDIGPQGVEAGYSIGLPAITAGVMNLQNISLSAGLTIPFTGDPVRLRFGFCERENPFLLTVYCFGGGGFVSLAVGLDGVEKLELALEFGANLSLDIGVASGGVYAMAGIYIAVEGDECALTGYLRMGGALEILGIITLSLEFYMSLTYESQGNKVWGEARLTIEIEIVFVTIPVEMSVRREFTDPELPKFADMMSEPEWGEYCQAFAA